MDPVARVGDVLDVGVGEQPLDFWVIIRAGDTERKHMTSRTEQAPRASQFSLCPHLMYAELAPPKNSVGPSKVVSKLGKLMTCSKCAEMASRLTRQA